MIALITKELRYYASQRKFRRIQPVIVGLLSLVLLAAAFELFAHAQTGAQINVGYGNLLNTGDRAFRMATVFCRAASSNRSDTG